MNARRLALAERYLDYTEKLRQCSQAAQTPLRSLQDLLDRMQWFEDFVYNETHRSVTRYSTHRWDWALSSFGDALHASELLHHLKNVALGSIVVRLATSGAKKPQQGALYMAPPPEFDTWRLKDRAIWLYDNRTLEVARKQTISEATKEAEKMTPGFPRSKPSAPPNKKYASTLTDEDVFQIREQYGLGRVTQQALADQYGVSQGAISFVCSGRSHKDSFDPTRAKKLAAWKDKVRSTRDSLLEQLKALDIYE